VTVSRGRVPKIPQMGDPAGGPVIHSGVTMSLGAHAGAWGHDDDQGNL